MRSGGFIVLTAVLGLHVAGAQPLSALPDPPGVSVGEDGIMRWKGSGTEVALFGVNYSTPFAFAYRAHERLGISHEEAMDADVAHMARLGFDAYRVHVWDREVPDSEGNLLENEHLRLLDYLIARLEERNISIVLTPIAWWGNGWPEPDTPTPGFSTNYSRAELSVDPAALRIQQNYIRQFLEHVNPFTGLAYKDDPWIIAFELFNEPRHPEPPEETTTYINELVDAARATGLDKPKFYNVSQNWSAEHARAVATSNVDGVSFQWYPAGLVRGRGIEGNVLPHVDHYPIPAVATDDFDRKARMVYEFDAADVLGSYIYPAMARSFREAGMQWATHFSYDPLAIADVNTEYSTHFVNLVYAPAKAISLMIAAEASRILPRERSYGSYPENTTFGPITVSYEEDLSLLNTPAKFYHSNSTNAVPAATDSLRYVAGTGSSPVVEYDGEGAYFLDRLDEGVWRLEVYPDPVLLRDPYGPTTNHLPVSRLLRRRHGMSISLPDLGDIRTHDTPEDVLSTPPSEATDGRTLTVRSTVVSADPPGVVYVYVRHRGSGWFKRFEMQPASAYVYEAHVQSPQIRSGLVEYYIVVERDSTFRTFPGGVAGQPWDWHFPEGEGGFVPVVDTTAPLVLFDPRRDHTRMYYPHQDHYVRYDTDLVAASAPHGLAVRASVESLEPSPHHFVLHPTDRPGDIRTSRSRMAGRFDPPKRVPEDPSRIAAEAVSVFSPVLVRRSRHGGVIPGAWQRRSG